MNIENSVYSKVKKRTRSADKLPFICNANIGELEVSYKYTSSIKERPEIHEPSEAIMVLKKLFNENTICLQEQFSIIYMNYANRVIGTFSEFKGSFNASIVDLKLIVATAVKIMASRIIIAHNHPSGNIKPSDSDKKLTTKLKEGLKLLDIELVDHIILSPDGNYISFANECLI